MKKYIYGLFLIFLSAGFSALITRCNAQEIIRTPFRLIVKPQVFHLDMDLVKTQDESLSETRGIYPVGRIEECHINTQDFNSWDFNKSGSIPHWNWNYSASCQEASGMNLYFSDLNLDDDDVIFVYSEVWVEGGAFRITKKDLKGKSVFATPALKGQTIRIKLYNYESTPSQVSKFNISGVGIIYDNEMTNGDGDCHVDVSCSEADGWAEQRDAVMRLLINEGGIQFGCTGTLMNNTSGNQRRLVLSALHCVDNATDAELSTAVATFNYERNICGSGGSSETNFLVGLEKLADSNDAVDGQVNPNGSDFVLLELEDEIPSEWNPYWAGWNSVNAVSSSGVTLHHGLGGPKKISTYETPIVSTFLGAPGSHWAVNWVSTDNGFGVTEPGSSGCPLFNSNGLVIGTLTGGFSNCVVDGNTGPEGTDYFGKLSYHWQNNPNTADNKLKVWLDPLNTGVSTLSGSYNPILSINKEEVFNAPSFYPNPAKDEISFSNLVNNMLVEVYDSAGKICLSKTIKFSINSLNTSGLKPGLYFVKFSSLEGHSKLNKLIIE